MTSEYQQYSLDQLKEWVENALDADITPQEVRDSIVNTVREKIDYHLNCVERSSEFLALLKHHDKTVVKDDNVVNGSSLFTSSKVTEAATAHDWDDFWKGNTPDELFDAKLQKEGYAYTPPTDKVTEIPSRY